ncbi:hypothetical protein OF83DRAFT_491971 [Amylostereum chailletii]|nr:hypothetical protein OF83DRAFT_491971 [Amylostereum chailletii]
MSNLSEPQSNVFLLLGGPGTGKTSIARRVFRGLKKTKSTAVAIFLTDEYGNNSERVWPAVALALAQIHPAFRSCLCRSLHGWDAFNADKRGDTLLDIPAVFKKSIVEPVQGAAKQAIHTTDSLVVIIDGLDRCYGPWEGWQKLVESCTSWTSSLPPNVKLMVTSRPHDAILKAFSESTAERMELHSGGMCSTEDSADVRMFLEQRLAQIAPEKSRIEGKRWPSPHVLSRLERDSAGVFSWANAVVDAMETIADQDRDEKLNKFVAGGTSFRFEEIDVLYDRVLRSLFEDVPPHFHSLVGALSTSVSKIPLVLLSNLTVKKFEESDPSLIENLCHQLLPLLYINEGYVELRHSSFVSYITDHKRCKNILHTPVNRPRANGDMALASPHQYSGK